MIPTIGSHILMQWGYEFVEARVIYSWVDPNVTGTLGHIQILDRSNPGLFGGSNEAMNFIWENVSWVYI